MPVGELFKRLERQTEMDLLSKASQIGINAQTNIYSNLSNPELLFKKKKIAKEIIWFFASVAIGFLMGYLFYELCGILLPEVKENIVTHFLQSNLNFIYFLSFISFLGVYITRLIVWALNLF